MSKVTKKYKTLYRLFHLASIVVLVAPLIYYLVIAVMNADTVQKVSLGIMFSMACVLTVLNIAFKKHYRSTIWILLLGIFMCLQEILPLVIMLAVATILDEFIFTPLYLKYKNLCIINGQIDRRIGE